MLDKSGRNAKKNIMKFILASSSPRRKDLLEQIGIVPDVIDPPEIDESVRKGEDPRKYALRVAVEKVEVVAAKYDDAFVLAADTIVALGKRVIGKAEDRAGAKRDLSLMSGRTHTVFSGLVIVKKVGGEVVAKSTKIVATKVTFKRMTDSELEWYLDQGEWEGKSGSFTLMGKGAAFIEKIRGSHTNVIGLPLCETRNMLLGMGFKIKD
jgi:septum formation protein